MVYAGNMEVSMPLERYYEKMSRYEGGNFILSPKICYFYEREADFLKKHVDKASSILDIGCAFGGLLKVLKK